MSCADGQPWSVRWFPSQALVGPGLCIAQGKDRVHSPPGKYTSRLWAAYRKPLWQSLYDPYSDFDTQMSCENGAKDSHQLALLALLNGVGKHV